MQFYLCRKSLLTSFSRMTGGLLGGAFSCTFGIDGWSIAILDLRLFVYCQLLHTIRDGVAIE